MLLRHTEIRRRRHREEKRRKLKERLKKASAQERASLESKLAKTYRLLTSQQEPAAPKPPAGKKGS